MANILNTGNSTVDAVGQMNITGNVSPLNWYKTILRDNGKPYLLAICILSDICYWYRPKEIRDENTGYVVEYRKRFKDDLLQRNYQQLADQFGESKRSVKAAMDRLEEIGVITRVWRNKTLKNGVTLSNILYIDLNEDILYKLTYCVPDINKDTIAESDDDYSDAEKEKIEDDSQENDQKEPATPVNKHVTKFCNTLLQNNVGGLAKLCNTLPQNNVGGVAEKSDTIPQNFAGGPTEDCETYTENEPEIIYENKSENTNIFNLHVMRELSSYQIKSSKGKVCFDEADMMDKMRIASSLIKHNVQYVYLIRKYEECQERIDELISIMVESIAFGNDIRIRDDVYPYALVRSRFEKYDYGLMSYVLESLDSTKTKVRKMKNYLLAALINAPVTYDNYRGFEISRDFGGVINHE